MIRFKREGLKVRYFSDNPWELKKLEAGLRYYVEGAEFSPSYRSNKWDGYYRFYERKTRKFNYGLLHIAIKCLEKCNIEFKIENDFERLKIRSGATMDPKLWQHQKEGIIRFLLRPFGTEKIPTRGGKTLMTAELVRLVDFESVLFVVDSQQLFEQALKDFSTKLGISRKQLGQIRGDVFEIKPITVAMIQTLQSIKYGVKRLAKAQKGKKPLTYEELKEQRKVRRVRNRTLEAYLHTVELLVIDEVHEYGSDERDGICQCCVNARGVLCLSATPEKSESVIHNIRIKQVSGPIIYEVDPRVLKERGVLAQEEIILVMINHHKNKNVALKEQDNYDTYEERIIVSNERRNNLLVNVVQILRHLGLKTLVLFEYRKHARNLQVILGDELLTGEVKLETRLAATKQFLKRKGGVMLATGIFNKGITLPEVQVMVNAGAGKEQSTIIQKKGRTLGTTATKKKAMTIDFIDIEEDYFSQHSLSRVEVYEREVGIECITVLDSHDENFYSDLREQLVKWRDEP